MARQSTALTAQVVDAGDEFDDLSPFEQGMAILGEVFGKEITPILARSYRLALRDLPAPAFLRAIDYLLQTRTDFMPRPAEIMVAAREVMTPEERGIMESIRLTRSWLAAGMVPVNYSPERLIATRTFLGLPAPSLSNLEYLQRERERVGMCETPGLVSGELEAFILGGGQTIGMIEAGNNGEA